MLARFYNKVGIDSRYRNLVAIGYMNEFVSLGISNRLEGTDGLNYLIRQELRQDQLQMSLEEISKKLDTIIDNQRMIYSQLQEMNRKSDTIVNGIKKLSDKVAESQQTIIENTALTAYYAERTAKKAEFQSFMEIYKYYQTR